MNYEHCCECGEQTGKAGAGDGSLYQGYTGPFCEDCFDAWPDKMVEENSKLKAQVAAILRRIGEIRRIGEGPYENEQ